MAHPTGLGWVGGKGRDVGEGDFGGGVHGELGEMAAEWKYFRFFEAGEGLGQAKIGVLFGVGFFGQS